MRQLVRVIAYTINNISRLQRCLLISLSAMTLGVFLWRPSNPYQTLHPAKGCNTSVNIRSQKHLVPEGVLPENSEPLDNLSSEEGVALPPDELDQKMVHAKGICEHQITSGDTLSDILNQYGIELGDIALLSKQHPALRHLRIGQRLSWTLDQKGQLQQLRWQLSPREIHFYQREGLRFSAHSETLPSHWHKQYICGEISNSFVGSARDAGLSTQEIQEVIKALQWQLDFRKLRKGDRFQVLLAREYLEGQQQKGKSSYSQLVAVRFQTSSGHYQAFRAEDGQFYDQSGHGLSKGFLRLPSLVRYPISSGFNPKRCHPITGRIVAHNGVDFVMPIGTPVITVGDGEVLQVGYNCGAGNYVVIRHGRQYITRYFHLRQALVKPGQRVKRGEQIAFSGNTGRSTAPHLHFELHVNNRPVNPMTVNLPPAEPLAGSERTLFLAKVSDILLQLTQQQ